jgi:hypothetical protein
MLMCCVCVFSLHRESPDMILVDKSLLFQESSVTATHMEPHDAWQLGALPTGGRIRSHMTRGAPEPFQRVRSLS